MTLDEILHGESKNIEYKVELPKRSEKYLKSVIAFANTNAVADSCKPQIIPDISFQTVEEKCIVIVTIYPGMNRPYYLKKRF